VVHRVARGLFNDAYAPITSSLGFLRLPLDEATRALATWRRSLYGKVDVSETGEPFPECLHRLEPLVAGARPREMLVATRSPWTAYFDCSLLGTDAFSAIGYLASTEHVNGVTVGLVPDTIRPDGTGRYGAVQLSLYGPKADNLLGCERVIEAVNDGGTWTFETVGEPKEFEELSAYKRRRIPDRFTPDMLIRYCQALGIDLANPDFYDGSVLLTSPVIMPPAPRQMTLEEVRRIRHAEED
jgi:hypothetical protein